VKRLVRLIEICDGMKFREFVDLIRETFRQWRTGEIARLSAALAFYAAFSFIPMLVVAVIIASIVFGESQVENRVIQQIREMVGSESAQTLRDALQSITGNSLPSRITTLISVAGLLYGATGLFRNLKGSLNAIWRIPNQESDEVKRFIRDTAISFFLVMGLGTGLLLIFALNTALFFFVRSMDGLYPEWQYVRLMQGAGILILFGASMLLFGVIYRYLPDAHVEWRDVWVGAGVTALLFGIGQLLITIITGQSQIETLYGAASTLIFVLMWVYISARIVLFGAVFTRIYANRHGSKIVPESIYQQQQKAM
jgi:membrane protein